MLVSHPTGNYRFLPGIEPYSSGVISDAGYEIVHVTLRRSVPYRAGFDLIDAHLRTQGRERAALCGVELRSPAPFTRQGFIDFNRGYREILDRWDVVVGEQNPVARTNVAPVWNPPAEPALFGFSYTVPAPGVEGPSFVVAGGGDLRGGPLLEAQIVRAGETSVEALREKAAYVLKAMERRLEGLGVTWANVTVTDVYTAQPMDEVFGPALLDRIGPATAHGLRWYHTRPPIEGLEFEMDLRGVRQELYL